MTGILGMKRRKQPRYRQAVLWLVLTAAVLVGISMFSTGETKRLQPASIYVVDGDTIDVAGKRFRLVDFDTPETYEPQCDNELALGNAATKRLRDLVESGQPLDLVILPGLDDYDRNLARFYVGGKNLADILTAEGLARAYQGGRRQSWC
ncbi:MAG: thermonuclease family protein [Pelagimonas sp.]|uniref:thermonuclease family protein n=1 Tax=Pelagimonas sp. TaxID=2073170 RepID=UPI003D6C6A51